MKVYLAGPDVFRKDAREYFDDLKKKLQKRGITALIPIDNDMISSNKRDQAAEIYQGNIKMIQECDAVLANIEPFRGPHMDPGTAFEIGYATALRKPVYSYTTFAYSYLHERTNCLLAHDSDTRYDKDGLIVENFHLTENLMITEASAAIWYSIMAATDSLLREKSTARD